MKISSKIVLCAIVLLASSSAAFAEGVAVKFKNTSKFEIHGVYLAPSKEDSWGPDQLGEKVVIKSGSTFTLTGIEPNKYDIKLVDEDGDECIVEGVKLGADQEVDISDKNLLNCQNSSAEEGEEEGESAGE
jgi:hypothetical protein